MFLIFPLNLPVPYNIKKWELYISIISCVILIYSWLFILLNLGLKILTVPSSQLSRPQVVKKIWEHIKQNNLQVPEDKRQIRCDEKMQLVFKTDKIHMFTMNKHLGSQLYPVEEWMGADHFYWRLREAGWCCALWGWGTAVLLILRMGLAWWCDTGCGWRQCVQILIDSEKIFTVSGEKKQ